MERPYVISVKRIKNYSGEVLNESEQYFEYFQYDNYAGSFSTGYPCFGALCHAEYFKSIDEAVETFNKQFNGLNIDKNDRYDLSTLAVRKIVVKTKAKLQWCDNNKY